MNIFKKIVLGAAGAALITVGLFSCSNEENQNPQQQEFKTTSHYDDDFERAAIAVLDEGEAVPLYDEVSLGMALVSEGIFAEVESIDLDYYYNSEENQEEALLTIIGKEPV